MKKQTKPQDRRVINISTKLLLQIQSYLKPRGIRISFWTEKTLTEALERQQSK
jgi:hypothetical protein